MNNSVHPMWQEYDQSIKNRLLTGQNAQDCFDWFEITSTMFTGETDYAYKELEELQNTNEWDKWIKIIKETDFIPYNKRLSKYPFSSGNTVHHAYHLYLFEKYTKKKIKDMKSVVEFGAGYGNTARIILEKFNPNCSYTIIDLVGVGILQYKYLEYHKLNDRIQWHINYPTFPINADLFIAEWSLSETPMNFRKIIIENVSMQNILICFNDTFCDIQSNKEYFQYCMNNSPQYDWQLIHADYLKNVNSYYLFGVQK
jgi:hypothetical protein